jgi:hypothetical protein
LENDQRHQVPLNYFTEVKALIQTLHNLKLNPNTAYMELGLIGEIGVCKFLKKHEINFEHKTQTNPQELLEDIIGFDFNGLPIRIDVKTTLILPHLSPRILGLQQFQNIQKHSDIIIWCYFSELNKVLTVDSWTKTNELGESRIKEVAAPPDFALTNDDSVELPFSETQFVYEVPSFLMREIDDLIYLFKGTMSFGTDE